MKKIKKLKEKIMFTIIFALLQINTVFASSTNVSKAIENTWDDASGQIKTVVDNVVFPAIALVLAVMFFVKLATAYFDYRKNGQFEFMAPAILFVGLIFALTAKLYVWTILGM